MNTRTGIAAILILIAGSVKATAQGMAVNTTGATAHSSAILDVTSTTKGLLAPRMTAAERTAIGSPATGLLVYQTDGTTGFYVYSGSAWVQVGTTAGTAGGDLTGSYPNPTIATTSTAGAHVVSAINAGTSIVAPANLGTGTASSSTYLRGDGTWATPSGSSTPKYLVMLSSVTPVSNTTTSIGTQDTVSFFGLGYGKNQWININAGSYIDPSGTLSDGAVPMPFGGTITSFSATYKITDYYTPFLAIFGNYTLTMALYYQPPPSGTVLGTATFYPVPGASASVNLTSACSICIFAETICKSVSGVSFAIAPDSRLMVLVTLSSSTIPSSLQSLHGIASASVGMQ